MDEQNMGGFDFGAFEAGFGGEDEAPQEAQNAPEEQTLPETEQTPQETEQTLPETEREAQNSPPQAEIDADGVKLPGEAIEQLRSALGADPVSVIRKGLQYDQKAQRETGILDRYAELSGLTREQYLDALENTLEERKLQKEAEGLRARFPDTPDEALMEIARQKREADAALERQKAEDQLRTLQAGRERINRIIRESRENTAKNAWAEYERVSGVHEAKDVPGRVLELVKGGMTPIAAYWQHQAESAKEAAGFRDKERENARKSAGSMAGAAEYGKDPFLRGFYSA